MKKVYASQDSLMVGHIKNILENHEIPCIFKNKYLSTGAGELPPIECWFEIWIVEDSKYNQACEIINETLTYEGSISSPWKCSYCGEEHEGQFTECWNCGKSRPDGKES